MPVLDSFRFSIPEIISLLGVAQCLYIIVYMLLRSGRISGVAVPLAYFSVLGAAFFLDFAQDYIGPGFSFYGDLQWAAWFYGPPLSVLMIVQISRIVSAPGPGYYAIALLIPAAYVAAWILSTSVGGAREEWLLICGLVAGAMSLLLIWLNKELFIEVRAHKNGKERYWLILALVIMNTGFLALMSAVLDSNISLQDTGIIRSILGLSFIYLASTSLLRIYPQAMRVRGSAESQGLSDEELALALQIEKLVNIDKVYQEPDYSRADLARECRSSEALVSKVFNIYFGKSFPQLMNEHRIEDAKRLLKQTDAPVSVIATEAGFSALPTFNRVFKGIEGCSPSVYRKRLKQS